MLKRQFGFFLMILLAVFIQSRTVDGQVNKLYWTDSNLQQINRSNLDGTQVETIIAFNEDYSYITASSSLQKIFYAIGSAVPQIWSANFDGSNRQLLATFDTANYVRGLSFDANSQKLYWTSSHGTQSGNGKVRSMNANGTGLQTILNVADNFPYGMAVDPTVGKLFWANTAHDQLSKANLNGSSVQTFASGKVGDSSQLTIDTVSQRLYWNDISTESIYQSNYDGTGLSAIGTISRAAYDSGIAVDHNSGYLFWGDTQIDVIYRSDLDGGNRTTILSTGLSYPQSFVVVSVPEPSTLGICILLLFGIAFVISKRKHPHPA